MYRWTWAWMTLSGRTSQRVAGEGERRWVYQTNQILDSNLDREHMLEINLETLSWRFSQVCYRCDRPGHFARECPNSDEVCCGRGSACEILDTVMIKGKNIGFLLSQWLLQGWPKGGQRRRRRQGWQREWVSVLPLRQVNTYTYKNSLIICVRSGLQLF